MEEDCVCKYVMWIYAKMPGHCLFGKYLLVRIWLIESFIWIVFHRMGLKHCRAHVLLQFECAKTKC